MSQACKYQSTAVLWGTVHLQSYLKGLLLSQQNFVIRCTTLHQRVLKIKQLWCGSPRKFSVLERDSHSLNFVNHNLGFGVTHSGLRSALISWVNWGHLGNPVSFAFLPLSGDWIHCQAFSDHKWHNLFKSPGILSILTLVASIIVVLVLPDQELRMSTLTTGSGMWQGYS